MAKSMIKTGLRAASIRPFRSPTSAWPVIALMGVALLPGCATTLTQSEIKYLETREIRRPFAETYNAALNAVFSMGMTISHSDKGSGVISGQIGDYDLRASMSARQRKKNPVKKVTLLMVPRGVGTTVIRIKVLINEEPSIDRELMTAIWQRVAREAMLDARPFKRQTSARRGT